MKELEFKTSKGEFILVDDEPRLTKVIPWDLCELVGVVKHMTEEQFARVMQYEETFDSFNRFISGYRSGAILYKSSCNAFESLIKSLGYYLFEEPECPNDFCEDGYIDYGWYEKGRCDVCIDIEDKVFFNPILLKKI